MSVVKEDISNTDYTVSQKAAPLQLIWHNFTNSQHLPVVIIWLAETDFVQFWIDCSKKF